MRWGVIPYLKDRWKKFVLPAFLYSLFLPVWGYYTETDPSGVWTSIFGFLLFPFFLFGFIFAIAGMSLVYVILSLLVAVHLYEFNQWVSAIGVVFYFLMGWLGVFIQIFLTLCLGEALWTFLKKRFGKRSLSAK
jgi:hypothetical protein